jgi:hypothetical protein
MHNILLRTTFKDELFLLKPFYKFYKDIWDPETYVFYVGYSKYSESKMITDINDSLGIHIVYRSDANGLESHIRNVKLYTYENLIFVLYETEPTTLAVTWDQIMRPFLYRNITGLPDIRAYKHYLNLDNDDFFYVKDVPRAIEMGTLCTHTFEFISHETFSLDKDMEFISSHYYYRLKGAKKRELTLANSHGWCRSLFLTDPYLNECHTKKSSNCARFDKLKDMSFNDLDDVCFAFGCIDLNYLLESKFWLQSSEENVNKYAHSREKVIQDFHDYYTLTDAERAANIIVKCNELKKYF